MHGFTSSLPPLLLCCLAVAAVSAQPPDPYSFPVLETPSPDQLPPPEDAVGQVPTEPLHELTNWVKPVEWDGSVEVGTNGSEGNSQSLSYVAGAELKRKTSIHNFGVELKYARTSANSIETQNYGQFTTKYERLFGDSPWTLFADTYLLYDEFQAFDVRVAVNGGVGYRFLHTEATTLTGRFGSGWSREIGGPDDRDVPEAVFGLEFERQIGKRQKLKFKGDYFPDWGDFEDYRLVMDAAWELLLDEEANLSLKLAANDRYDSTPNGREPNDINYSLVLLWKL